MASKKSLQQLIEKKSVLEVRLLEAEKEENRKLANRGWGYGMRHSKIGFSTVKTDGLKERIRKLQEDIDDL